MNRSFTLFNRMHSLAWNDSCITYDHIIVGHFVCLAISNWNWDHIDIHVQIHTGLSVNNIAYVFYSMDPQKMEWDCNWNECSLLAAHLEASRKLTHVDVAAENNENHCGKAVT